MRASDDKSHSLLPAALLAVVVSLVGLAGAVKIAQTAVALGPSVGDIIQFDPRTSMPIDAHTEVGATRTDARDCVLDIDTIHRDGGSLVVEQRIPGDGNPHFLVHWAGKRSADGTGNCGSQANLMLDDSNLDLLAMAAGGWGVGHKHIEPSGLWNSVSGPRGS